MSTSRDEVLFESDGSGMPVDHQELTEVTAMRVLVTSTPGTGHIHPLVPVARALLVRGHEVTWAVAEPSQPIVRRFGFSTVPAGMATLERVSTWRERFGPVAAAIPPDRRRAVAFSGHFAHLAAPRMLDDLLPLVERETPDLVVHETAELAGPVVAEWLGIPHATVAFSGAVPDAAVAAAKEPLEAVWGRLDLAVPADLGLCRWAYFHPLPSSMGQRPNADTVHDLRPGGEDGSPEADVPDWVQTLGRGRPAVYVTFGTEMGALAPWSIVVPALGELGEVDAVVTIGASLDPAALGPLPANVRVEKYVPQSWLLPRCRLVVSHAGAGTLLAAAAEGIPQLCLPLGADQFENMAAYLPTGAGGQGLGLDGAGLVDAMRVLLADGRHRAAAAALAREIAALPGPERAVSVLEGL